MTKRLPFEPPPRPRAQTEPSMLDMVDPAEPFDRETQNLVLAACGATNTEPPVTDELGHVQCAQCSEFVPYATMSLNEDGCFCARCASQLTATAVADQSDEDAYKL